jgi:hypothetical protein
VAKRRRLTVPRNSGAPDEDDDVIILDDDHGPRVSILSDGENETDNLDLLLNENEFLESSKKVEKITRIYRDSSSASSPIDAKKKKDEKPQKKRTRSASKATPSSHLVNDSDSDDTDQFPSQHSNDTPAIPSHTATPCSGDTTFSDAIPVSSSNSAPSHQSVSPARASQNCTVLSSSSSSQTPSSATSEALPSPLPSLTQQITTLPSPISKPAEKETKKADAKKTTRKAKGTKLEKQQSFAEEEDSKSEEEVPKKSVAKKATRKGREEKSETQRSTVDEEDFDSDDERVKKKKPAPKKITPKAKEDIPDHHQSDVEQEDFKAEQVKTTKTPTVSKVETKRSAGRKVSAPSKSNSEPVEQKPSKPLVEETSRIGLICASIHLVLSHFFFQEMKISAMSSSPSCGARFSNFKRVGLSRSSQFPPLHPR